MMYPLAPGGLGIFFLLRSLFSLSAFVGFIFLLGWTIKYLPDKKLRQLSLWLLTVGIVGAIFMSFFAYKLHAGVAGMMDGGGMMRGGGMMWDDDGQ